MALLQPQRLTMVPVGLKWHGRQSIVACNKFSNQIYLIEYEIRPSLELEQEKRTFSSVSRFKIK